MKIVIPMAGRGSRFFSQGVEVPKPLIKVGAQPMIAWALKSVEGLPCSELVFVALREHERRYGLTRMLAGLTGRDVEVVLVDDVTEGQLCTVLAAREIINDEEGLLIASSDTYVVSDLALDIANCGPECRGLISVANVPGDRWSFARVDEGGRVVEVAEKQRISEHASTGLYYFSSGAEFVGFAEEMVGNRERTRGEYYVMPVYQKYLQRGLRVQISIARQMWDMGTPEALANFEERFIPADSEQHSITI